MNNTDNYEYLNSLEYWLRLKVVEFSKLGYDSVSVEDLRHYLNDFLWKRQVPTTKTERIYQIMQITPNDYWDFVLLETQITKVKSLNQINLRELF